MYLSEGGRDDQSMFLKHGDPCESLLQIRSKVLLRFGTRIAQVNIFIATFDSCNVMLDNHSLNYWSQEGTASWPLMHDIGCV